MLPQKTLFIIMGVSGSGKTTLAKKLEEIMNLRFIEGDDLHPESNVKKMSQGYALSDEDRYPWLKNIIKRANEEEQCIVTCSALKEKYRLYLRDNIEHSVLFICLEGERDLISKRLQNREGHFMPGSLLTSQYEAYEPPLNEPDTILLNAHSPVEDNVQQAIAWIRANKEE